MLSGAKIFFKGWWRAQIHGKTLKNLCALFFAFRFHLRRPSKIFRLASFFFRNAYIDGPKKYKFLVSKPTIIYIYIYIYILIIEENNYPKVLFSEKKTLFSKIKHLNEIFTMCTFLYNINQKFYILTDLIIYILLLYI